MMSIEHDLDVIARADWVIDLGPEGGVKGGAVVGESAPEGLVANARSHTGAALRAGGVGFADTGQMPLRKQ